MYRKCCVVSCDSRRKDVNLYKFPKSETGLKMWLQLINCDKLRSLSLQDLKKCFVCKKHFEKRFHASTRMRSRLRVGAYPTLFTIAEINSGIPQQNVQLSDNNSNLINIDHGYCKRKHEDHTYCKAEVVEKRPRIETKFDVVPSTSRLPLRSIENIMPHNLLLSSSCKATSETTEEEFGVIPSTPHLTPKKLSSTSGSAITLPTRISRAGDGSTTKLQTRRKRVIYKKQQLSSCCTKLYKEYVKSRKQVEFNKRSKRAMKFSEEKTFEKLTNNINPLAKKILWMQIKQCTKKAKGRRFSDEEKLIALSILKQSPRCYRFLHKIFILPSKYTLNKMVAQLQIDAGINPQLFNAIKQKVTNWEENKKYCTILFDEVALEAALTYDKHKDLINGFVELNDRTNEFADHALVFLLRGALYKWQQPLAFYFCKGATNGVQLKEIIKKIVETVSETGLLPLALVSDQGTAFQSALKSLQEDTRREQILAEDKIDDVIMLSGHTLSVIFDPPHLIKGIRNNFLTKNIKYKGKISKWSDIVDIYKTDCNHTQMRMLHKLNDECVIPEKIKKMKVANCVKALSESVSSALSYTSQFSHYVDGREVSSTLENTAEVVGFFDKLFDSVNGAAEGPSQRTKKNQGKPLRHAVTKKSTHHEFWPEAIETLKNIKFIDSNGRETSVPSLKNWIITLKSMQRLWQFFNTKKIPVMRPRYFNSDPIENFFGQVRAYNFRNNDPNCHTFKNTFRSLLITRFIQFHSENYNCEEDSGEQLLKLKSLFEGNNDIHNNENDKLITPESSELVMSQNIAQATASQERLNIHSRAYTTGWVIRKILTKVKCEECEKQLTSDEKNCLNKLVSFREYKSNKKRKLTYPSEYAVILFGNIVTTANEYLENSPHRVGIIKDLKIYIQSKYSYDLLACDQHKSVVIEYFFSLTLKIAVFNWCNVINKILKGTDVSRLINKSLPCMQLKAFNKYKTKLKKKTK